MRPIFVLGSPRSGTTLIGNYIASHPGVTNLGEFFGFYLTLRYLRGVVRRVPGPYVQPYLEHLFVSTRDFADQVTSAESASMWCDQTPWNLLVASALSERFPNALFVLCLRHYSGVILSLRRSFEAGYDWAGRTAEESAKLWARFSMQIRELPRDRTIVVSYDALCADPEAIIAEFRLNLAKHLQIDPRKLDDRVFAKNHASGRPRNTLAQEPGGVLRFQPIPAIDSGAWTDDMEKMCRPHIANEDQWLRLHFGNAYRRPDANVGGPPRKP